MDFVISDTRRSEIEARVLAAISRLFGIAPSDLGPTSHMDELPAWDSMGHMELIVTLEREFGVSLPTYRLHEMVSVPAIVDALLELDAGGAAT
jgi:acyl carrier protein